MKNLIVIACFTQILGGCTAQTTIVEDSNKLYSQIEAGKSFTYDFSGDDDQLQLVLKRDNDHSYSLDYSEGNESREYYLIDDQLILCKESCEQVDTDLTEAYISQQVVAGGTNTSKLLSSEYAEMTSDTKDSRTVEIGLVRPDDNGDDQYVFIERATIDKGGNSSHLEADCIDPELCKSYEETITVEKVEKIENPMEQAL